MKQKNDYVVNKIGKEQLQHLLSVANQMGKVYTRLILDTMQSNEDYADAILRVYNCSVYYEPSYVIARAYHTGGF